jgi:cystathionine beta-lyase
LLLAPRFDQRQVDAFCDALQLFKVGYSWGGPVSLVMPYALASMRQAWPSHLKQGTVVRFSVGLEALSDLQLDIAQAVRVLESA